MEYENITLTGGNITRELDQVLRRWTDGSKKVIANINAPTEIRERAAFVGTDEELAEWVERFPYRYGAIYVVSEGDIMYDIKEMKPSLQYFRIRFLRDDELHNL